MKKPKRIYHVHEIRTGEDHYYNSVNSIFDYHNRLRVTYAQLKKHFRKNVLFENDVCKIKKGWKFYGHRNINQNQKRSKKA